MAINDDLYIVYNTLSIISDLYINLIIIGLMILFIGIFGFYCITKENYRMFMMVKKKLKLTVIGG